MPPKVIAIALALSAMLSGFSEGLGFLGKGNELMAAERYDEAAAQFRQALAKDKTLPEAQLNLGICEFQLRNYAEARKLFEQSKGSRVGPYYLGRIDLIEGKLDEAIANFRAAGNASDSHGGILDSGCFLGISYFKKGLYAESIKALSNWISLSPRDFRAHEWLARALNKAGRPAEATTEFQLTRDLHDYYTEGSVRIVECREFLRKSNPADAWLKCRSVLDSDDVDKVAALALTFGQSGDQSHAAEAWRRAIALDPESPELNYDLSLACFNLRDLACARQHAEKAVALWPRFPEANVLYGTILYMLAEDAVATQVLTRAQELRPDDTNVARLLSDLRSRQN
jgi:tetratricopeptide (TPR) repeat protein